jgi:hypothetical protein
MLIMEQFPETTTSVVSFKVDSDVVSLDGRDFLETDAEIGQDGKLHVTVRKSNASRQSLGGSALTPWPSNLTAVGWGADRAVARERRTGGEEREDLFYAYNIEWESTVFPNALRNTVATQ